MATIKLQCSSGKIFDVNTEIAKYSSTIQTMLKRVGKAGENEVIPLPNINSAVLEKIIQWMTHHKDDPFMSEENVQGAGDKQESLTNDISPWDTEFLNVDQEMLFALVSAANYLDIKGLLHLTCKYIAIMLKGKNSEEIRQLFNIKNDFTIAEEQQIEKESHWCQES